MTERTVRIAGRVVKAGSNEPLPGSAVFVNMTFGGSNHSLFVLEDYRYAKAVTDAEGTFCFELPAAIGPLPLEALKIIAWGPGHDVEVRSLTVPETTERLVLELSPIEQRHGYRVDLFDRKRKDPIPCFPVQVHVVVRPRDTPEGTYPSEQAIAIVDAMTGADGVARFEIPPWASLTERIGGAGVAVPGGNGRDPELGPYAMSFDPGGTLVVEARDGGNPAAGAFVRVIGGGYRATLQLTLDAAGRGRFVGVRGRCSVLVYRPNGHVDHRLANASDVPDLATTIDVARDETRRVSLDVPEASARLVVTLRTDGGAPATDVSLYVVRPDSIAYQLETRHVTTNALGVADFGALVPGTYRVHERHGDPCPLREIALLSGPMRIEFIVRETRPTRGIVVDEDGLPVSDASVLATGPEQRTAATSTDSRGRFELLGLLVGKRTQLVVHVRGRVRRQGSAEIEHDGADVSIVAHRRAQAARARAAKPAATGASRKKRSASKSPEATTRRATPNSKARKPRRK